MYTQKKMEHIDKALLQAVNSEVNGVSKDEMSLSDLINESLLNDETSFAANAEGCVIVNVVIGCDSSGNMIPLLDENLSPALGVARDIKISNLANERLEFVHSFMARTWTLKRQDGSEWHCCLTGDRGVSRLMLSAALHYTLNKRLGSVDQEAVLNCQRRTKLIKGGDWVEFFVIKVKLYPQYKFSRGIALVKKVRVNFIDMTASSGPEVSYEIESPQLDLERAYDDVNREQYDDQDQEWERDERER